MQTLKTDQMIFTDLRHMPIVKAYANKIETFAQPRAISTPSHQTVNLNLA
jgi:hypothetical protein